MLTLFKTVVFPFIMFAVSAHAEFDRAKFEAYLKRMTDEGKPATLIIGCGHKHAHHKHQDHWTVDIADFDQAALKAGGTPESFSAWGKPGDKEHWKSLQADDEYDITNNALPIRYKEKFDQVVLEHVNNVVSNNPISVTNAHYMLKEGGKLFMEVRLAHHFTPYEKIYFEMIESCQDSDCDEENNLPEDVTLTASLSYDEQGIKAVEECIDTADEITKPAILAYIELLKKFTNDYEVKRYRTHQTYMIMVLSHLGFKNIISLIDRCTYDSPFSREKTPVIFAEKVKLDQVTFRRMRGIVAKFDYKPRVPVKK